VAYADFDLFHKFVEIFEFKEVKFDSQRTQPFMYIYVEKLLKKGLSVGITNLIACFI